MSIMPYRLKSEFVVDLGQILFQQGLQAEARVESSSESGTQARFVITEPGANVVLLVCTLLGEQEAWLRMGFREGWFRRLTHGDGSLRLARRVETILRNEYGAGFRAEAGWLGEERG